MECYLLLAEEENPVSEFNPGLSGVQLLPEEKKMLLLPQSDGDWSKDSH